MRCWFNKLHGNIICLFTGIMKMKWEYLAILYDSLAVSAARLTHDIIDAPYFLCRQRVIHHWRYWTCKFLEKAETLTEIHGHWDKNGILETQCGWEKRLLLVSSSRLVKTAAMSTGGQQLCIRPASVCLCVSERGGIALTHIVMYMTPILNVWPCADSHREKAATWRASTFIQQQVSALMMLKWQLKSLLLSRERLLMLAAK